MTPDKNRILIIVHPGSACGSADFQIGKSHARAYRDGLVLEANNWGGGVIVLSGSLDDELGQSWYNPLGPAIDAVLARAKASGLVAIRRVAHDPDQVGVILEILKDASYHGFQFVVTGAWAYEDRTGCVYSVEEAIQTLGLTVEVSDHALSDKDQFAEDIHS